MKKAIIIIGMFLITINANSQSDTSAWKLGGDIGINFSQIGFTNWAQGGENSLSGLSFLHLTSDLKKGKWLWSNYGNFEYGLIQQGVEITKKSDDLLEIGTKLGHQFSKHWYYSGMASFKSQFSEGYDYEKSSDIYISKFMAPAFILAGLGLDYHHKTNFTAYLSPITLKEIIVNDDTLAYHGAFGVQKYEVSSDGSITNFENTRMEIGAYMKMKYKQQIVKNVDFVTYLELYSDYLENPQNVDVDWKVEIIMKVNSFLNASIKTHLIYDDNSLIAGDQNEDGTYNFGPKVQFKEAIAVGLIYKFSN